MKVSRIEVVPHTRNPVGSFAVIKLFGISQLEGTPLFQLVPAHAPAPSDWPVGDLKPLGVRAGRDLVELLIGPEIVKSTALQPGTAVHFRMPSVGADVRIDWPDLSGDAGAKPELPRAPGGRAAAPLILPSATTNSGAAGGPGALPAEQGLSRLRLRGPAAEAALEAQARAQATAASEPPQLPPTAVLRPTDLTDTIPHDRQLTTTRAAAPPDTALRFLPLGLGLVIVAAMLVTFLRTTEIEGSGVTLFAALRTAVVKPDTRVAADIRPNAVLTSIFDVGPTSPAGVDASSVTQREALERANKLLASAQTPHEREEAAYWLRRALSHRLSEPRLVWALSQLGTAYASSDKDTRPNYAAARLLWGWAADAGDAHAACFLGRLYERGLGVPADPAVARSQYERAQRMGGCPGLDQALLRVGKKS